MISVATTAAPHTAAERVALGKAARERAPRSSHAAFEPAPDRADPVALLERQAATRVPELVPIRYGRMLVSPFAFYRGAAKLMASDLQTTPSSGLRVQACGDAHLSNFGAFASPDRRLVFDANDFDETLPGPWEWDLKRLAVSMLLASRENGYRADRADQVVLGAVAAYREAMREFAGRDTLSVWYARLEVETLIEQHRGQIKPSSARRTDRIIAKARTRDSMSAFEKWTEIVDGEPRIVDQSPLIVPIAKLAEGREREHLLGDLQHLLADYRDTLEPDRRVLIDQFHLVDVASKVVGVGSVGMRAWIALLLADDGREPLFLQIKEAQASVLEEHVGASEYANHGERVVVGQRIMQASSDILLGWLRASTLGQRPVDYYVRQLRDWKGTVPIDEMRWRELSTHGRMCGWTLARAHARSGDRVAIAAYLGGSDKLDRALLAFAHDYAEQNERDYHALEAAVAAGRVEARRGL